MTAAKKLVRDYYHINVPGDIGDKQAILNCAIDEARERAKLHCIPANWEAKIVAGEVGDFEVTVRVCRIRAKR